MRVVVRTNSARGFAWSRGSGEAIDWAILSIGSQRANSESRSWGTIFPACVQTRSAEHPQADAGALIAALLNKVATERTVEFNIIFENTLSEAQGGEAGEFFSRGARSMLNIGYFKGLPTEYVIKYSGGALAKEGPGLAFYYLKHNTQVMTVPTSSMDSNFVFNEVTNNFQSVTIQGQFTYRIHDPKKASALLNFTLDPASRSYVSNDPDRLPQRITNVIQTATRSELESRSLEEVLARFEAIAAAAGNRIKEARLLESLGVELLSVFFTSAQPTPEVARALEAEYRESLLRKADEAVSARRAAAVEEERKIKENELNTEISLEEKRKKLITLAGENARLEAENKGAAREIEAKSNAKARELELGVYKALEPKMLTALAMNELGQRAAKIGNLTITTELLASLLGEAKPAKGA